MNIYENIVIINASLTDEETETAIGKIKDLIINSGGEIIRADLWGRRKLAYEINKHKKGFYVYFLFKAPAAVIKKLEGYYKVFDPVIKYMVIKPGKKQLAAMAKAEAVQAAASADAARKSEGH